MKQVYFVSKQHSLARPSVQLLTDRLTDIGWGNTQRVYTLLQSYTAKGRTFVLTRTSDIVQGMLLQPVYAVNDKQVSLTVYLNAQAKLSSAGAVYNGCCSYYESVWRLQGSAESIVVTSTEQGVFMTVDGDSNLQDLVSEYYAQTDEPGILWSATDNNGMLFWTAEELDD